MILDFGSFTRRELLVDPADIWWDKARIGQSPADVSHADIWRHPADVTRHPANVSPSDIWVGQSKERAEDARAERRWKKPETPLTCRRWQSDRPIVSALLCGDFNDLEGLGFHCVKLSKV